MCCLRILNIHERNDCLIRGAPLFSPASDEADPGDKYLHNTTIWHNYPVTTLSSLINCPLSHNLIHFKLLNLLCRLIYLFCVYRGHKTSYVLKKYLKLCSKWKFYFLDSDLDHSTKTNKKQSSSSLNYPRFSCEDNE